LLLAVLLVEKELGASTVNCVALLVYVSNLFQLRLIYLSESPAAKHRGIRHIGVLICVCPVAAVVAAV